MFSDKTDYCFFKDGDIKDSCMSYTDLAQAIGKHASWMQTQGWRDQCLLLVYPSGIESL